MSARMLNHAQVCRVAVLMVTIPVMFINWKEISKEAPWNN